MMNKPSIKKPNVKKSLIAGGLVGTAGLFVAKAIGLIYSIPFSSILSSDAYMSYYGSAYRIYSYILNVFTAGAPMAIATMVAQYMTRKQYKTVLEVRRLSVVVLGLLGTLGMLVMVMLSSLLGGAMAGSTPGGPEIMTKVLCILAIAIFFVPILSAYRGFIQGCKEMQEYAFSQAFEQIFRVGFLLSISCLLVYGFNMDSVFALYTAVLSTSVAAIAGILQIARFSKRKEQEIAKLAKENPAKTVPFKPLLKEFIQLCIPYLVFAILGYANDVYDAVLLPVGLAHSSYSAEQISTMMSAANYVGVKLTAIPMILSPGFVAAIIPHITSSLEEKNYRKMRRDIKECINIVLFIALFLSYCILLYAKPLFYSLYYTSDLDLAANSVQWIAVEGLFGTITPVITSLMMALRMRKELIRQMLINVIIKGILMVPMVMWWGIAGAVLSSVIAHSYLIGYCVRILYKKFKVSFSNTVRILICSAIGLILMTVVALILYKLGLGGTGTSKMICFVTMAINGLISASVFAAVEWFLGVPQVLFHIKPRKKQA